jgi:D-serine deaminase-like pyridoxal phosphate-dependent protein
MASYFAADDWNDITIAFPLNHLEAHEINRIDSQITLNVLAVEARPLIELNSKLKRDVGVFIEIDTGSHRSGVDPLDAPAIDSILKVIESGEKLNFLGFLSHAGHSYKSANPAEVEQVHRAELEFYHELKSKYKRQYQDMIVSIGDTPSFSCCGDFTGIDEARPGNFVFYDVMQSKIGSCSLEQVAIALACPVVAVYPARNEVIVHGGAVHLSKDTLPLRGGAASFGEVVRIGEKGWGLAPEAYVRSVSQEHGVISGSDSFIKNTKAGDVLAILPVHSCLTADCMKGYTTMNGEPIAMMP